MIKKLSSLFLTVSTLITISTILPAQAAKHGDVIQSFDSVIVLGKDSSLYVNETIDVDFGKNEHHGIIRFIPTAAIIQGQKLHCHIKSESASVDGSPVTNAISQEGDRFTVKIGDANKVLSGQHRYALHYFVYGAVRLCKDNPELYWNVTGNDWKMPIQKAKALLILPEGLSTDKVSATSFAGNLHSKQKGTIIHVARGIEVRAENLAPGQGLTLAAQVPDGSVVIPGLISEWQWQLEKAAMVVGAVVAIVCGFWWLVPVFAIGYFWLAGFENASWNSSGGSSLDFGSSGDGFGGGGGDTW